ncbi:hypothetical protein D3C76_1407080 [compost metagenome]
MALTYSFRDGRFSVFQRELIGVFGSAGDSVYDYVLAEFCVGGNVMKHAVSGYLAHIYAEFTREKGAWFFREAAGIMDYCGLNQGGACASVVNHK